MGNTALSILFANSVAGSVINFETLHRSIESESDGALSLLSMNTISDKLRGAEREFYSDSISMLQNMHETIVANHDIIMQFSKGVQDSLVDQNEESIQKVHALLAKLQQAIFRLSDGLSSITDRFESAIDDMANREFKIVLSDTNEHLNRVNELLTHLYTITIATERSADQWLQTMKN